MFLLCVSPGCDSGTTDPGETTAPILGSCNVEPSYISQVKLNRWREFPLRYEVFEFTFAEENRDDVLAQVLDGVDEWAVLAEGRIGSLVRIVNGGDADFTIVAMDLIAASARTIHAGERPFLSGGRIIFDRQTAVMLSQLDGQILSALAAHEMGHLLGIVGHPVTESALMRVPIQSPRPTTADLNTLSHAYCR